MRVTLTTVMCEHAGETKPTLVATLQGVEAHEVRGLDVDETRRLERLLNVVLRDGGDQLVLVVVG